MSIPEVYRKTLIAKNGSKVQLLIQYFIKLGDTTHSGDLPYRTDLMTELLRILDYNAASDLRLD